MKIASAVLFISTILSFHAFAGIQIQGTRIIVHPDTPKTLKISNLDPQAAMVQLWIDEKNESLTIKENLPFVIQPPIAKISGNKTKSFRIIPLPESKQRYATDRESLIWFNALEIPGENKARSDDAATKLKLAFRMRLKLFYRPAGLKGTPLEAGQNLKWELKKTSSGYTLTAKNASPFHVSFTKIWLGKEETKSALTGGMVKPFSEESFKITAPPTDLNNLNYKFITDIGAIVHQQYQL